nr:DEAD/DEAH box helicase [Aquabacterium terrae]
MLLQTLTRGDGLLGLRPCGPVVPPARTPLFGARGPQLTLARLQWFVPGTQQRSAPPAHATQAAAIERLQTSGLRPLPADALQWRGPAPDGFADGALWSLVQEAAFGDWWADQLPALQRDGWAIVVLPGFAHQSTPVEAWRLVLDPLDVGGPEGRAVAAPLAAAAPRLKSLKPDGSWMLGLGIVVEGQTLDLIPMLTQLIAKDRRWLDAEQIDEIEDHAIIRLRAPGGRRIDAPAAPLKAIARTMLDLLGPRAPIDGRLVLARWEARRLEALRVQLRAPGWALRGEAGLRQLAAALAEAGPPAPVAPPAGLGITLRGYQHAGLAWLQQLRAQGLGGILADDMGLGKTAQALAHLLLEKHAGRLDRPALVVAPASLLFNWQAECARVAPALRLLVLQGPQRTKDAAMLAAHDVVLVSYPLLWRDAGHLRRQPWHAVILDEAQTVKNAGSRTATAARRLDARHRLCLTGTPVENHLGELWAQFHFLMPGFLGDAREFARRWRTPIEKNGETLRARLLAQRIAPFLLRRRKDEVAPELPPLTEQVHRVRLDGAQRLLYESVRAAANDELERLLQRIGFQHARLSILDALLKLRQVCNDPRLLRGSVAAPADAGSAKLDWLRTMLPALVDDGRRVLLFSQFTRMLRLIEAELDAAQLPWLALTGATPPDQRGAIVQRFQSGTVPLLLLSLKAGGVGLNLTAADTVIHIDPWWNPAVEDQASARAHRIGQDKPVLVYKLIVAGSIEERMRALQSRKRVLADSVLGGAAGEQALPFDEAELRGLMSPLDDDFPSQPLT